MKLPERARSIWRNYKEIVMCEVGSEVKLSKGKRAAKYVVVGFEKPLPLFEEGGGNNCYPQTRSEDSESIFREGDLCITK